MPTYRHPAMHLLPRRIALAACAALTLSAHAAADDALDLEATPAAQAGAAGGGGGLRVALEVAGLHGTRSDGGPSRNGHRLGVDLRWAGKLSDTWRFGLSNRLDHTDPPALGLDRLRNSLREAHLSWQPVGGSTTVEFGRINVRHGPGYGYNPTDYFRTGATRLITSADPLAIRQNRLGTVMLQSTQAWSGGSATLAMAPRLDNGGPSDNGLSLDLGATNARHRLLASTSLRVSDRWTGEALALVEEDASPRLGLNFTGLVSDALVLHGELSSGRSRDLLSQSLGLPAAKRRHQQATLGATLALPGGVSVTVESAYNSAGLGRTQWQQLFGMGPAAAASVLASTQASQELASRQSWLLYATKKSLVWKQLDAAAFVRQNQNDSSWMAWAELRYRGPAFDLALQYQRTRGNAATEYGALPYRQVLQLSATAFF